MKPDSKLAFAWYGKWGTEAQIKSNIDHGMLVVKQERMLANMQGLFDKAYAEGELAGRANLRKAIEDGHVPPIQVKP